MNVFSVKLTSQAEMQMREAAWYIAVELQNPDAANGLMDDFAEELPKLGRNPERNPLVDEEPWRTEGIRWKAIKGYMVYFWIDIENAAVQVIGIVHEKRERNQFLSKMKLTD